MDETDLHEKGDPGAVRRADAHNHAVPPKVLPGFPRAIRTAPKAMAGQKMRPRWIDQDDGTIFEFDRRHNTVEKYDRHGNHQGEFDLNGKQLKEAQPTYKAVP